MSRNFSLRTESAQNTGNGEVAATEQGSNNSKKAAQNGQTPVMRKPRDPFKIFLKVLYAVSFAVYIYFVIDGIAYYQTPYLERPHHEDYRTLRPAGFQGHAFGIIGSAMMLLMLLYTVRKRTRFFGSWGNLSRWLDIHIYFGIMGPLLVILHTSFKVQGLVAVSFWSMIAVASSGVLGRYLYLQIPRNWRGDELSLQQIMQMNERFNRELQETLKLDEDKLEKLNDLISSRTEKKENLLVLFSSMILRDLIRPFQIYRLKKTVARELHISEPYLHRVVHLAWRNISLQRRIVLLNQIQRLFHYWHVFHKPFAIIMYIIMFVHVGVAVWLGYTWIF